MIKENLILPLHGLRGLAAMSVVLAHSRDLLALPVEGLSGSVGVMLFFALSGFLMGYLYLEQRASFENVLAYARARVARIYPLFALVCVLAAIVYAIRGGFTFQMSPARLVQHLLLFGDAETIWTISTECQFYALFILLWLAHSRLGHHRDAWLAAICLTIIAGLWLLGFPGGRIEITGYLQIFLTGMLAALTFRNLPQVRVAPFAGPALLLLLLVVLVAYANVFSYYDTWEEYRAMWLVTTMGLLVLAAALGTKSWTGRLLGSKPLKTLGDWSYGIYLLHAPWLWVFNHVVDPAVPRPIVAVLLFAAILGSAALAYRYVERPARNLVRQIPLVPSKARQA